MSPFEQVVSAHFSERVRPVGNTELENLLMTGPGICLLASANPVLRRRLMACMVMVEITRQVDASPGYCPQINIYPNGNTRAMIGDLLALDKGFEPDSIDITSDGFGIEAKSIDDLGILSIAGGLTNTSESDSNNASGEDGRFNPLFIKGKPETFSGLVKAVEQAKQGSMFVVENVHCLLPPGEPGTLSKLLELRNKAVENGAYVYLGACVAGTWPGRPTPPTISDTVHESLAGIETFADSVIVLKGDNVDEPASYLLSRTDLILKHSGKF